MMLDIQQKRKFRGFLYHKFTLIALFVVVLLAIHSTWSVYNKKKESIELMESSYKRLEELENRDSELNAKISKLNTESGLEEEIRSKYSVAKDSENMVIIVKNDSNEGSTTPKKHSFWDRIIGIFK